MRHWNDREKALFVRTGRIPKDSPWPWALYLLLKAILILGLAVMAARGESSPSNTGRLPIEIMDAGIMVPGPYVIETIRRWELYPPTQKALNDALAALASASNVIDLDNGQMAIYRQTIAAMEGKAKADATIAESRERTGRTRGLVLGLSTGGGMLAGALVGYAVSSNAGGMLLGAVVGGGATFGVVALVQVGKPAILKFMIR